RPMEFATRPGSGLALLVLERRAEAKEVAPVPKGGARLTWESSAGGARALARSPDGSTVAVASGRELGLLDMATGKEVRRIFPRGDAEALAFSPNGKWLAIAGHRFGPGAVRLVEPATGRDGLFLPGHKGRTTAVA